MEKLENNKMTGKNPYQKKDSEYFSGVRDAGLFFVAGTALIIAGHSIYGTIFGPNKKDFQNARWMGGKGTVEEAYKNEDILHSFSTKRLFMEEVKKRNGSLEGTLILPDLDGNGKVGIQ